MNRQILKMFINFYIRASARPDQKGKLCLQTRWSSLKCVPCIQDQLVSSPGQEDEVSPS